jgi:SAM-dependent methyltransferase
VASELEPYREVITHGANGLLAGNTPEEWREALEFCLLYPEHRDRMAERARQGLAFPCGEATTHLRRDLLTALLEPTRGRAGEWDSRASDRWRGDSVVAVPREVVAEAFLQGNGIEIGALQLPLPVPAGVQVRYVDRMGKEALYAQYPELRPHPLVDVDVIDDGEHLSTFGDESEDFVIANHFLEHTEDPIGTLKNFMRVVRPGGCVFLAVPDKRFTFDQDRERTSLDHILADHQDGGEASRFNHLREWVTLVEPRFGRRYDTEPLMQARIDELLSTDYSIHYHVWISDDLLEVLRHCRAMLKMVFEIEFFARHDEEIVTVLRKAEKYGNG